MCQLLGFRNQTSQNQYNTSGGRLAKINRAHGNSTKLGSSARASTASGRSTTLPFGYSQEWIAHSRASISSGKDS